MRLKWKENIFNKVNNLELLIANDPGKKRDKVIEEKVRDACNGWQVIKE